MRSPLTVRVGTATGERHLRVRDLSFTSTDRGGFESATFTVPEWVDSDDPALAPLARVKVDDARTGERVWEGYLDLPGRTVEDDGHSWRLSATGAKTVLDDRSKPCIYIDRDLRGWRRKSKRTPSATAEVGTLPDDEDVDALVLQFPPGSVIENNSGVSMQYRAMKDAGQDIGGASIERIAGLTSAKYQHECRVAGSGVGTFTTNSPSFDTTGARMHPSVGDGTGDTFQVGCDNINLWILKASGGATNVANDHTWGAYHDIWVRALLKDAAGNNITSAGAYDNGWVLAHEVVTDALHRLTDVVDVAGADIASTFTHQIDQLAYPDGVRLGEVMADLAALEPDMAWAVLGTDGDGLHGFRLWQYDATPRYVLDTRDGWSAPGGEAALANAVRVYWTDSRGREQSSVYTTTVDGLDQWGRVRDAEEVHLGSEVGSQAAADRIGQAVLDQIATVPHSGTLRVARPVLDCFTGRRVMPWEILPGHTVRVRDLDAPDMRLTEVTYDDGDAAASLTLGTPVFDTEQLVAKLTRRRRK